LRLWRKNTEKNSSERGVARAALDGASRQELLNEALKRLARQAPSCRLGVWLETGWNAGPQNEFSEGFRGMVWDRGSTETPSEWARLSIEPPLPEEQLLRGKTVEQDLEASPPNPILGLLAGLRHALWVPIERKEQLKGIILAGSIGKQPAISREGVESVAAELALALGLQEEEAIACLRSADLNVVRRFFHRNSVDPSLDALLSYLAESCRGATTSDEAPGAAFAAIGVLRDRSASPEQSFSVEFRWHSGDDSWKHAIDSAPLSLVWRRAMETRQVIGSESQTGGVQGLVARIVALPLESEGQLLGVLIAGIPSDAVSLAILDRLALRATLAASALRERRQNAEEAKRASRQSALLDCIQEPFLLLDDAGKITAASRGARELTGIAAQTSESQPSGLLPQTRLPELFCEPDRERLEAWLRPRSARGVAERITGHESFRTELRNGTGVRLSLPAQAQAQATVVLLELLVTRESPGQAGTAEIELQNVIEWLEEGVILFDAQDNVRAMNTRFEQIAGLAPEECGKFKTLDELIVRLKNHASEPARFAERWRELARGIEGGIREELQMTYPAPRILERAARPVLDPIGRLLGRVEIYRDLTAQRVFHSKLLQTEKLAALGQMVSGVAHELSNPLTSIMGYAHRLLARKGLPGRTEELRQIHEEAERASAILRQLLQNARETIPERHPVSLNQIVQRAVNLQRFILAAEKIRLEIDLDPALPFVHGDPGHLQQVLMNLVTNARQAIEQHSQGGTIQLRTKRIGEQGVLLEVADDGPGIPQAILARIFDPFFTTKPAGIGTGLGLAIVLSVVREHGGQVNVSSPPQGGAIFQVELPAATEAVRDAAVGFPFPERKSVLPEVAEAGARRNRFARARESGKGARVLVVEDEPTVARLIADVLEDEHMVVDVLLDGREALGRAATETFDLVICDMKMPGLDGQHFYKSLERSGNPLRKRFLFVTGDIIAAHTREFLERNHLPHVAKPFRVEELTEKVHSVLAITGLREPPVAEVARKNAARNG
jgi:signal transduction histidine kinase/ActR/RegA family two-component response regulator